jgi:hypothetical protein
MTTTPTVNDAEFRSGMLARQIGAEEAFVHRDPQPRMEPGRKQQRADPLADQLRRIDGASGDCGSARRLGGADRTAGHSACEVQEEAHEESAPEVQEPSKTAPAVMTRRR